MTTNFSGAPTTSGSAKIYPFPARGRFAAGGQRDEAGQTTRVASPPGVKIASGGGWYHDAAIQEAIKAERAGKN